MSFERPNRFYRLTSLRGRLSAWNTAAILVLTVSMLVGVHEGLSYTVVREVDQLLSEDIAEVRLFIERTSPPQWDQVKASVDHKAQGHAPRQWFCQVFDSNGATVIRTEDVPPGLLPEPKVVAGSPVTGGDFRFAQERVPGPDNTEFVIRVGSSLSGVKEDVDRSTQLVLIAGAIVLVVAPLGGYILAGRAIRPLAKIIEATAGLRPSRLDERLPLRRTGDELDQLSVTINGFLDRIGAYLGQHRDLIANAAHELRSPLAAMRSTTEVALTKDRTAEEYKETLGAVVEECDRLGSLVQQLLLLAESDANRLERTDEPVHLDRLVRQAVAMFEGVAEAKGVVLTADTRPVVVTGDAGHIRQVVMNLIDNAVKFAPGGRVTVYLTATEGGAELAVADTGPGIPAADLPRVFERFYRGDRARARGTRAGSGLGLSICQAIVAAHGGTIRIASEPGKGTTVRVLLPVMVASTAV